MKETKKQENKKTNIKDLDFKLVHTGTTIVAPWNDKKIAEEATIKINK